MQNKAGLQKFLPELSFLAAILMLLLFNGIFIPFIVALALVFLIAPSIHKYQRLFKNWELSASIYLLAAISLILGFLLLFGNFIAQDLSRFNDGFQLLLKENKAELDAGAQSIQNYLQDFTENDNWQEIIDETLAEAEDSIDAGSLSWDDVQAGFEKLKGFLPQSKETKENSWKLPEFSFWFQISGFFLYFFLILYNFDYFEKLSKRYRHKEIEGTWKTFWQDFNQSFLLYFKLRTRIILLLLPIYLIMMLSLNLPGIFIYTVLILIALYIPYLQYLSLIPMSLSALVLSSEIELSFWIIMAIIAATFIIASIIEEMVLIPWIMEKNIGMNPAIMALGLSFWTFSLGNLGILIGIPLTSLVIIYFKRFIIPLWFPEKE